jgi:hypothetical protein
MESGTERVYDAGAAIDELLEASDSSLLAAMAYYKANMVALFGNDGFMEMLKQAVDAGKCVSYFSKRSRAEMNFARPVVRLRVNDEDACRAYPGIQAQFKWAKDGDFGYGGNPRTGEFDPRAAQIITNFKAAVVMQEICRPLCDKMNAALCPHWEGAKAHLVNLGANAELQRMMVSSIFSIVVSRDSRVHSRDKMVQLGLML